MNRPPAFCAFIAYPRQDGYGMYLEGPRSPEDVRRRGYRFTPFPHAAWPFPSLKQAEAKALIVDKHMGWGEGVMGGWELDVFTPGPCSPVEP